MAAIVQVSYRDCLGSSSTSIAKLARQVRAHSGAVYTLELLVAATDTMPWFLQATVREDTTYTRSPEPSLSKHDFDRLPRSTADPNADRARRHPDRNNNDELAGVAANPSADVDRILPMAPKDKFVVVVQVSVAVLIVATCFSGVQRRNGSQSDTPRPL